MSKINTLLLEQAIAAGLVIMQKHPDKELFIYNYTTKVQYERIWNQVTLACRGLILDIDYNIVARPFPKFFNLGETTDQTLPDLPFEVYEKMDGSLGILYWIDDLPYIATRGSFNSIQSMKANDMLHGKYGSALARLDKDKTYLFEIIYPQNRIVLDYGATEALVLLAIIDTQPGLEFPLQDIGFPIVRRYDGIGDFQTIKAMNDDTKEGFVIRFANNFRVKVKFKEYLRLHRILTQINSKDIWDYLRIRKPLNELLDKVPDEFYQWVKRTENALLQKYEAIEKQTQDEFKILASQKETALYFLKCKHPPILFAMLNKKDYQHIIWKMVKPSFENPFVNIDEG